MSEKHYTNLVSHWVSDGACSGYWFLGDSLIFLWKKLRKQQNHTKKRVWKALYPARTALKDSVLTVIKTPQQNFLHYNQIAHEKSSIIN